MSRWLFRRAIVPGTAGRLAFPSRSPRRPPRLGVEALEARVVPAPAFDYRVGRGEPVGSSVTISSSHGIATAKTDRVDGFGYTYAHFANPPEPDGGLLQGYWAAEVRVLNGWVLTHVYSPVLNADGVVYNADAGTERVRPDVTAPTCPTQVPAAVPLPADGNDNFQPPDQTTSESGVRSRDGAVSHTETDLASDGFASPWGQSRSWSSLGKGYDYGQLNGNGWVNPTLPVLRNFPDHNQVYVTGTGTQATTFRKVAYTEDTWVPTLAATHTLTTPNPGEYTLTDEQGNRFVFNDANPVTGGVWNYTTDVRATQKAVLATDRAAACWYSSTAFTADVTLSGGTARRVSLYFLDWDRLGRSQRVEVLDAATGAVLDTRDVSSFGDGKYLSWNLTASVRFRVTNLAGPNAVLSGVFFDPASGPDLFAGEDAVSQGTWHGAHGADGHTLIGVGASSPPAYGQVAMTGAQEAVWAASTTDVRGVQEQALATDRVAYVWSSPSGLAVDVDLTGGPARRVSLYLLDWTNGGRSQRVDVVDAATEAILDTRTVSGFTGGKYLSWNLSGHVRIKVTRTAASNVVLSGVFLDPVSGAGIFAGEDAVTQGTWRGVYGADGYILGLAASVPADAAVGVTTLHTPQQRGQLVRYELHTGEVTEVTARTPAGHTAEVQRRQGNFVESWRYTYGSTLLTADAVQSAALYRSADGGTTWQPVRSVEYRYYDFGEAGGNALDLKSVTVHDGDLTAPALRHSYYRYYTGGEAYGYKGGLKYVVTGEAFDRLAAAYGVAIETAGGLSDAQVAVYAEKYFRYDALRRATTAVIQGAGCSVCGAAPGQGTYRYEYARNPRYPSPDPDGDWGGWKANAWEVRTTETLPDGNQNVVYSNFRGQTMLKVFREAATGREWQTFTRFDDAGRVLWVADVAAVTGYSEQYDDLLHQVNGNYEFLSDTAGLITEFRYGTMTTATESQPGDAAGYLRAGYRWHGEGDPHPEPTVSYRYYAHAANGTTTFPLAGETTYPVAPATPPLAEDGFQAPPAGGGWQAVGGGWTLAGGVVRQVSAVAGSNKLILPNGTWAADQEVVASVRVDTWGGSGWARAGVGVRTDPATGRGYNLVFSAANEVRFLSDDISWSAAYTYAWQVGVWYRFRLRVEGTTLSGKVWRADETEPAGWMFQQTGWVSRSGGVPALTGGSGGGGSSTASFDDVTASSLGANPPAPPVADGFTGPGWVFGGGVWQQVGGVFAQTGTPSGDPNKAILGGPAWPADQEVVASVRVDAWGGSGSSRAGVGVRTDPVYGRGYDLVFSAANQVRFLSDAIAWGNAYTYAWQVGVWYRFRLRAEGAALLGKVWRADEAEPVGWMFRQDGWTTYAGGSPALVGGSAGAGSSTASFDDVSVPDIGTPAGPTTVYTYEWFDGPAAAQYQSVTVQAPAVSAAENGSGAPDQAVTVYDALGRPVWVQDGAGFLHYTAYDTATGAVVARITDVDT
ncbi:MAG TPA: hypothetical protein VFG68_21760, partial [Fimbriiglobus sp.]|nr:hypothetical protein [Fimbriiglobus sp.]